MSYIMYAIAIVCFVLAVCAQMCCPAAPVSTVIMVIIGAIFAVVGYLKRPEGSVKSPGGL